MGDVKTAILEYRLNGTSFRNKRDFTEISPLSV
jgi:hypothetical protein